MVFSNFLAPVHDYTDLPFRLLCQRYGAAAACVPLISCAAIARGSAKLALVDAHPDERNIGVQLVGNDAGLTGKAAKMIADAMPFVSWFNINCGCPSARTTGCGGGSAMLREPVRIAEAVAAVRNAVGVPVSVKIRIKNGLDDTVALCRLLEVAGADFVIIHARRTNQGYSGNADWDFIKALKERLDVPLVGNGDIGFAAQGRVFVEDGYCDSFMVGRAAMCNPMLFSDKRPASVEERFGLLGEYVELHKRYLGEPRLKDAKLKAVNLISGVPEAAAIRGRICRAGSVEDVLLAAEAATSL